MFGLIGSARQSGQFGARVSILSVIAAATGGTTATITVTASPLDGTLYWYVSESATPPSSGDLIAGAGAADSGSFEVMAVPTASPGPSGLTPSTAYWVHAVYETDAGLSAISSDDFMTEAADVTAPVLSSPSAMVTGETTASASVSTNEGRGNLYWVATGSATPPSAAQIRLGQDGASAAADDFGSQAVSATGVQAVFGGVAGLTEGETYYLHFVQDDPTGNASNIVTTASFIPADITPPVLSSPDAEETGSDTADASVNTDSDDGTLYWVASTSATAPSAAQIIAGNDHTGSAADSDGSQAVTATGPQNVSVTGLSSDTTYTIHFAQRDAASNDSNVVSSSVFTTASATFYFVEWEDGVVGSAVTVNAVTAGAYADSSGGSNAILWSGDGLGTGTPEGVTVQAAVTFADAISRVRFKAKNIAKVASKMWLRIRPLNVTSTDITHVDITNDGTADGSRVGTTSVWTNVTCTAIGGGWFQFQGDYNAIGDGDRVGALSFTMSSADNAAVIVNNVASTNQVALFQLTMEQLP